MRRPDPGSPVWVDGRQASQEEALLPLDDPGFQSGLGLFETLALRKGRTLDLDLHLDRLAAGAARIGVEMPRARLGEDARNAAASGPACGWLKIVLTGGGRSFVFFGTMDPAEEGRAATAALLPWHRSRRDPLAGLKTLSYAGNVLGLGYAQDRGADEGLWLNDRGHLAEGCTSNLFVARGRRLFTPGAGEGILPGIVRGRVIEFLRKEGLVLHEGRLRTRQLQRATEAFLTSSLRGVRALVEVGGRPVGSGRPGPLTRHIADGVGRLRWTAAAETARA